MHTSLIRTLLHNKRQNTRLNIWKKCSPFPQPSCCAVRPDLALPAAHLLLFRALRARRWEEVIKGRTDSIIRNKTAHLLSYPLLAFSFFFFFRRLSHWSGKQNVWVLLFLGQALSFWPSTAVFHLTGVVPDHSIAHGNPHFLCTWLQCWGCAFRVAASTCQWLQQ